MIASNKLKNLPIILTRAFIAIVCFESGINPSCSQELNDTIVTLNGDTIYCNITLVNNYNIFYDHNPKRKKIVNTYVARADVQYFTVSDSSISILEEETPPEPVKSTFTEENGLIFASRLTAAPVFLNGQNDLYDYLERHVKVYPRDIKVFDNREVLMLFEAIIDSIGNVKNVSILKSSAETGGFDFNCRYLEEEIRSTIMKTETWKPATIEGKKISTTILIPLKFKLNIGSITILPSKYIFNFKGRE